MTIEPPKQTDSKPISEMEMALRNLIYRVHLISSGMSLPSKSEYGDEYVSALEDDYESTKRYLANVSDIFRLELERLKGK